MASTCCPMTCPKAPNLPARQCRGDRVPGRTLFRARHGECDVRNRERAPRGSPLWPGLCSGQIQVCPALPLLPGGCLEPRGAGGRRHHPHRPARLYAYVQI